MNDPLRLVIVDDQQLFREALKTLFSVQTDFVVVGEAGNGAEAVDLVAKLRPDIVLLDLRMPVMDGVEATRLITTGYPNTHVIMLTTFDDDSDLFDGLRAGAVGYLLKDISSKQLFDGIRAAARGEFFLMPSATAKIVAEFSRLSQPGSEYSEIQAETLTRREIEILKLVSTGASNRDISEILVITEGTVKNHISNILGKLDVKDRLQAAVKARQRGWI
ncbi:MAG: DNA-binding response regulator [Anaerolinea sp.]|nr:DNA-binding response regulator [Anaerolinea sp.]